MICMTTMIYKYTVAIDRWGGDMEGAPVCGALPRPQHKPTTVCEHAADPSACTLIHVYYNPDRFAAAFYSILLYVYIIYAYSYIFVYVYLIFPPRSRTIPTLTPPQASAYT
jgi:hypothetical protein